MKYIENKLSLDGVLFNDIFLKYSTPVYVYSQKAIHNNLESYMEKIDDGDLICFSVKSSNNLEILKTINSRGAGFDVVSSGELRKVIHIGADVNKIVYSGVGKTKEDLIFAVKSKIKSINIESLSELKVLVEIVKEIDIVANIALRFNPETSSETHPYLDTGSSGSKFGIPKNEINECLKIIEKQKNINLKGLAFHIGSDIKDFSYFQKALQVMLEKIKYLNIEEHIEFLDVGGGLAIKYFDNDEVLSIQEFVTKVKALVPEKLNLIFEPGKSIIGNAGYLLAKVLYKKSNILLIDAGMNDHIRVPLYNAKHQILPVKKHIFTDQSFKIAGPVCESADIFDHDFHYELDEGELLVIGSSGAYGFSMSSNYNARLRPAEVMISNEKIKLIRRRETFNDFISEEVGLE